MTPQPSPSRVRPINGCSAPGRLCTNGDSSRLREIAASVGISERRAHDIVVDLTTSGYLAKQCEERRNTREVQSHRPLGDDLADHRTIGDMLALLTNTSSAEDTAPADDSWIPWAPS